MKPDARYQKQLQEHCDNKEGAYKEKRTAPPLDCVRHDCVHVYDVYEGLYERERDVRTENRVVVLSGLSCLQRKGAVVE